MRRLIAGAWCSLSGLACQGDDWIIAGAPGAGGTSGAEHEMSAPEPIADGCPSAADSSELRAQRYGSSGIAPDHVGLWRGRLGGSAAAGFPSSDLEVELDTGGQGWLRFDTALNTEGRDDPERGYLCSAGPSGVVCGSASGYVGGYAYPLAGAGSRERVLSFSIVPADPWGSWCAQREPVAWDDPVAACGRSFAVLPPADLSWSPLGCSRTSSDGTEPIDCALMYALEFCQCARDACFAAFSSSIDVGLALSADGATLSGSLWFLNEVDAAPVTLTRAR